MNGDEETEIGTEAHPVEFVDGCSAPDAADALVHAADLYGREMVAMFEGARMTASPDGDEDDDDRHDERVNDVVARWLTISRDR